jgi:hypothetical protein
MVDGIIKINFDLKLTHKVNNCYVFLIYIIIDYKKIIKLSIVKFISIQKNTLYVKINLKNNKIIIITCIFTSLIIIISPAISSIEYKEINNNYDKEIINVYNNKNLLNLNNEILLLIIDLIILILQSIIIIPIFIVEDIIDIIWNLIEQIEDPLIKKIFSFYNNIIESLWYICLGFYFPIILLVYILDTIRDSINPEILYHKLIIF